MTDSDNDPLRGLLSQFALGPAWARGADKSERAPKPDAGKEDRPPRREDRQYGSRDREGRGERRPYQGGGQGGGGYRDSRGEGRGNYNDRRGGPPQREEIAPAAGIRVSISPDQQAVHLIGKEVHQVARVYPLFDVAQTLLAEKARLRALFEVEASGPVLYKGKLDESLFLTREEALRHLWQSELRNELLVEEEIEVDPPSGNFQSVARCGLSGEYLGPPNFHSYQTNLRRLHRERFSNMPFEAYAAKVRTERGEEAVNAWLETTKKKTRWRLKDAAEDAWMADRAEAERALATEAFDKAFGETRAAEVNASIPARNLSPSLLASLRIAGGHARKHPAILIPAVCRALESEHLPVFKRQGKLFTGPARPHALAADAVLAERPGKMVAWIRANKPAKLAGLWESVLPEGSTAPPAEYAADLFWLLQQGHILLFTDDTLTVQEVREPQPQQQPKEGGKKKKDKSGGQGQSQAKKADSSPEAAGAAATTTDIEAAGAPEDAAAAEEPSAPGAPADSDTSGTFSVDDSLPILTPDTAEEPLPASGATDAAADAVTETEAPEGILEEPVVYDAGPSTGEDSGEIPQTDEAPVTTAEAAEEPADEVSPAPEDVEKPA